MKSQTLTMMQFDRTRTLVIFVTVFLIASSSGYRCFAWDEHYPFSVYSSIDSSIRSLDRLATLIEELKQGSVKNFEPCRKKDVSPQTTTYDHIIEVASALFDVEGSLIKAVIRAESNFHPTVVSQKNAAGLMQLIGKTANSMGVRDPYDPYENVMGGTRYLSLLLKRYNYDKSLALAAYNAGPQAVDQFGGIPPFPETMDYVQKVLRYYKKYKAAVD